MNKNIVDILDGYKVFFGGCTILFLTFIAQIWLPKIKKKAFILSVLVVFFLSLTFIPTFLKKPVVEAKNQERVDPSVNKPDSPRKSMEEPKDQRKKRTEIGSPSKKTKILKANDQPNGQGGVSYSMGGGDSASDHSTINKTINVGNSASTTAEP